MGIDAPYLQGNIKPSALIDKPPLVAVAFGAAQPVVHMSCNDSSRTAAALLGFAQRPQQGHAISPARHGRQHVNVAPRLGWPSGGKPGR